jgi:hypothetical protein
VQELKRAASMLQRLDIQQQNKDTYRVTVYAHEHHATPPTHTHHCVTEGSPPFITLSLKSKSVQTFTTIRTTELLENWYNGI